MSVLSCNCNFIWHFPAFFQLEKDDILAGILVDILIIIYRVLIWVLWETTNCSKLGYFMGVLAELCGFLGGGKGSLSWFKFAYWGFLLKGLIIH